MKRHHSITTVIVLIAAGILLLLMFANRMDQTVSSDRIYSIQGTITKVVGSVIHIEGYKVINTDSGEEVTTSELQVGIGSNTAFVDAENNMIQLSDVRPNQLITVYSTIDPNYQTVFLAEKIEIN